MPAPWCRWISARCRVRPCWLRGSCCRWAEFRKLAEGIDLSGLAIGHDVRRGVPMAEISAAARLDPPELLVMGTAGRRGFSRVLLGSTAHDLLEHLPCDVLLVRG